ncbi:MULTISPECIES: hypothetical protein [unclassified Streptomyces]|uniref:hypothetical protein n=1 Tax=unclassified Streptomyces TaxID=2593676 RepID=UPI0029A84BCA|nr:hypothetical protein [Streptomyces sp. DK15]MDX2391334.1 hypothetical protein [Streptomyces sp. DK15]
MTPGTRPTPTAPTPGTAAPGTPADAAVPGPPAPSPVAPAPALPGRPVRRLRPGVAVTPLRDGLHLRGRRGNLTLEGSSALPRLWRRLEAVLPDGGVEDLLDGTEPGSALHRAVETLLAQLDAHDMLVTEPARPPAPNGSDPAARGPLARWLGASAHHPARAAAALATARAEILAGAPEEPLARSAGDALTRGGLPVTYTADPHLPEGRILLRILGAGPDRVLAVGRTGGTGWVTAPGSTAQARSDAEALEARLGGGAPVRSAALVPLLAGAAAHRLLSAAAGLADPSTEGDDGGLQPGLPAVLLADSRPLRAEYRTWLGPDRIDADRRTAAAPATTLGEALRRVTVLTDERCGALPEPLPGELRQLPVPLAACLLPGLPPHDGRPAGGAPRLDLARLEVFCRAAEHRLGEALPGADYTVGANLGHARGRALREAISRRSAVADGQQALAEPDWSGHPQVRHWWTTLTTRLAVPARLEVFRIAPGEEAYRAVVHRVAASGRRDDGVPQPLGDAVEATPGDAAAYAALAAVATCAAGPDTGRARPSGGAVAPLASAGAPTADWEDAGWTGGWLAETAAREDAFQGALARLTGTALPERPPAPDRDPALAGLLRAHGFTVLPTPRITR